MGYREILVHLDATPRSAIRLGVAARLATRYDAHLIGLDVKRGAGLHLTDRQHGAATTEEAFHTWLSHRGLKGEWRLAGGSSVEALAMHGRCTDLIVIGQCDPHDTGKRREALSEKEFMEALRRVGTPVLAVPYVGSFASVGERILVAWNGSSESTRAVNDALPLLCGAKAVMVLLSDPKYPAESGDSGAGADILLHLSRHGVIAQAEQLFADNEAERGDGLLNYAADFSADLIVVGALMRSRVHGLLFGDVVRTLIRRMTAPIFFSS